MQIESVKKIPEGREGQRISGGCKYLKENLPEGIRIEKDKNLSETSEVRNFLNE